MQCNIRKNLLNTHEVKTQQIKIRFFCVHRIQKPSRLIIRLMIVYHDIICIILDLGMVGLIQRYKFCVIPTLLPVVF